MIAIILIRKKKPHVIIRRHGNVNISRIVTFVLTPCDGKVSNILICQTIRVLLFARFVIWRLIQTPSTLSLAQNSLVFIVKI